MARYENKELGFEVPQGWEDRSVISFEAPKSPETPLGTNVTLMRVATPPGQALPAFAAQQLAGLANSLPGFELVEQRNVQVSGLPAVQLAFHWEHPDGALTQRITMFMRDPTTLWSADRKSGSSDFSVGWQVRIG